MTLLIDADYLIYSSCAAADKHIKWDLHTWTSYSDERDVMQIIESRIEHYHKIVEEKHDIVMCFSSYPTFRHEIFPEYKLNRINKPKPFGLKAAINTVKKEYHSVFYDNLEGDDVLGLCATNGKYKDPIIVSVDKDMRTIPCKLLAADDLELVTRKKADRQWMIQSLSGDPTDNYKGLDKVGVVTADKIIGDAKTTEDMWNKVVAAYEKKGQTVGDAILTARLARILREGDYDYNTGEVKLWNPKF